MKQSINKWGGVLLAVFAAAALWADGEKTAVQPKDYASCLAAWDSQMQTLQTDFIQTTEYDGLLVSRSAGRLYFRQKGPQLRLDNIEGGEITQRALTDKKKIYILDEKGKEVSRLSWADWVQTQPNQALFDFGHYAALLAKHTVQAEAPANGAVRLTLIPKGKADYTLFVTVSERDCFPQSISVRSDLMQTTAVLSAPEINTALASDVFKGLK